LFRTFLSFDFFRSGIFQQTATTRTNLRKKMKPAGARSHRRAIIPNNPMAAPGGTNICL